MSGNLLHLCEKVSKGWFGRFQTSGTPWSQTFVLKNFWNRQLLKSVVVLKDSGDICAKSAGEGASGF